MRRASETRTYSQVVADLSRASIPIRELHGPGNVAVTLAAGRIIALAFSRNGPNLLWSNPELKNTDRVRSAPGKLVGGIGGDRLWFSPELRYHWTGKPDWHSLHNYEIPAEEDPGHYAFMSTGPDTIALGARGRLPVRGTDHHVGFSVERTVRLANPPIPLNDPRMRDADYVGIETIHNFCVDEATRTGEIDLWHVLQTPVDSILIVPLRPRHESAVLSYGLPGSWETKPNCVIWRFKGNENAKIGIAARAMTGRSALLRRLRSDRWCLVVREFPTDPAARYGDHPDGVPRHDQVFQAWDGLGFGEMEYHSPLLDAQNNVRMLRDVDQLWALGGSADTIAALADALLQVDIGALIHDEWKL